MRILFVHNALRSFVRVDRDILASAHEVDELDLSSPMRIVELPPKLIRADVVYAWFASLHSFLPVVLARALGKPSIVVVGGYDTADLAEIGYGHMTHPLKRHVVRAICAAAASLVANSKTAAAEVRKNLHVETPIKMIYQGLDPRPFPENARQPLVLTVGNVSRESRRRKGHEVFVRAASLLPEVRFVLVGHSYDDTGKYLRSIAPSNLEVTGFLPQPELDALYARASVYVQASAHEGFGLSVIEAMAAGCLPAVSRKGALPEVVGEYGIYLEEVTAESIADAVREAMLLPEGRRREISEYIEHRFPLSRRRDELLGLVSSLR